MRKSVFVVQYLYRFELGEDDVSFQIFSDQN